MIAQAMRPAAADAVESQPRASVLVVDDEPTIGEVVARYLERAGYRTRVAGDGAQALALCAEPPRTSSCSISCSPGSTASR